MHSDRTENHLLAEILQKIVNFLIEERKHLLNSDNDTATYPKRILEYNCNLFQLTRREIEVYLLIERGLNNRQIAVKLYISERTVGKHIQNLFQKVGASNKIELIHKLNGL